MNTIEQRQAAARRYAQIMSNPAQRDATREAGMAEAPVIACAETDTIDDVLVRARPFEANVVGLSVWRSEKSDIELMRLMIDQAPPSSGGPGVDAYPLSGDAEIGMILDSRPGRPVPDSLADAPIEWGRLTTA